MDSPFSGNVANEKVGEGGRSETLFSGYNKEGMMNQLRIVFKEVERRREELKDIETVVIHC